MKREPSCFTCYLWGLQLRRRITCTKFSVEQQKTEKMNKANVEQLLNYAVQEEKSTQQRLNRNKSTTQSRKLRDNW